MDYYLLIKATFRIYLKALKDSLLSFKKCWRYLIFHLLIVVVSYLMLFVASLFPGMAGGFIMGLFLAFAVSCYLASLISAFNSEQKSFKTLLQEGAVIFSPVINVFFCFFLINLLLSSFKQFQGLILFANLIIAIVLNPIPEIILLRPASITDMFSDSFEFIRDNILEWFLPIFVLLLSISFINVDMAKRILFSFSTDNPLRLIEFLVMNLSLLILKPFSLLILVITYYILLFRLYLFHSLSNSSRRKRIYSERNH